MRKWFLLACVALLALAAVTGSAEGSSATAREEKGEAEMTMRMCINDTPVEEDNPGAEQGTPAAAQ